MARCAPILDTTRKNLSRTLPHLHSTLTSTLTLTLPIALFVDISSLLAENTSPMRLQRVMLALHLILRDLSSKCLLKGEDLGSGLGLGIGHRVYGYKIGLGFGNESVRPVLFASTPYKT